MQVQVSITCLFLYESVHLNKHLSTYTVCFECQYAHICFCSGFLLSAYACTGVAFPSYVEYSCFHACLRVAFVCMDPMVYTLKYISSCACACEVWVCVCVLTLASCSCRGSLVASGQLSSWERCSHTIWANLSTLPLSACSNSHAWHTHMYIHNDAQTRPRMYTFVYVYTQTKGTHIAHAHTQDRERMAALVGLGSHS